MKRAILFAGLVAFAGAFAKPNMIRVGANPDFAFAKSPDNKSAGEKSPIDKEYYIAAYPVTNGEYAEFLAENKSVKPPK